MCALCAHGDPSTTQVNNLANVLLSFRSRVAKEAKKAKQAEKKVTKAPASKQQKTKAAKVSQKAAPRVGGKR